MLDVYNNTQHIMFAVSHAVTKISGPNNWIAWSSERAH